MIKSLFEFYQALNVLLSDISVCKSCQWINCRGYVWLMQEESENLVKANIPVVEINNKINFIHSFPEIDNKIDFCAVKPKCIVLRSDGLCKFYKVRPLSCRLYPFDLEVIAKRIEWIVHKDCEIIVQADKANTLSEFCKKFLFILDLLSNPLKEEIISTYRMVDSVSILPDGISNNRYILKKGGYIDV